MITHSIGNRRYLGTPDGFVSYWTQLAHSHRCFTGICPVFILEEVGIAINEMVVKRMGIFGLISIPVEFTIGTITKRYNDESEEKGCGRPYTPSLPISGRTYVQHGLDLRGELWAKQNGVSLDDH